MRCVQNPRAESEVGILRKIPTALNPVTRMVRVTDDWNPCFEGNTVQMTLKRSAFAGAHICKLSVWGADDKGVELEFRTTNELLAIDVYELWKTHIFDKVPDGVDKIWFFEHGFLPA